MSQPVEYAYLFGSRSRGEDTSDSDVDILIKLDPSTPIGLFKYAGMINDLENILGRQVDLVDEAGLDRYAKPFVDKDKILIYERAS